MITENRKKNRRHRRGTKTWQNKQNTIRRNAERPNECSQRIRRNYKERVGNIMIIVNRRFKITESEFERIEEEWRAIKEKSKQTEKLAIQIKLDSERRMNKQKIIINWINIKETNIHNQYRYRNEEAILKQGENKLAKIPLITKYKFIYNTRKWRVEYMVQSISKSIKYIDFCEENRDILVKDGKNKMEVMKIHRQIKENAMKKYRERLRNNKNPTTEEY